MIGGEHRKALDAGRIVFTGLPEGWRRLRAGPAKPGWTLIHRPLIESVEIDDLSELDAALEIPSRWNGIVLTSPRAAAAVARRPGATRNAGSGGPPTWWAIGPATAEPLEAAGLVPLQPSRSARTGEGLAARILTEPPGHLLYPGTPTRSDGLTTLLRAGGWSVREIDVYRVVVASDAEARAAIEAGDVIIASSARVASLLARNRPLTRSAPRLVVIGATSARAAIRSGWPPARVADGPDAAGVLEAIERVLASAS